MKKDRNESADPGKARLLLVSMHYKPEPCDLRISQLAVAMRRIGYQATTLTTFPNYPFGKVYAGYKQKLWHREWHDNVEVVRVPMLPDHSPSAAKRALSYASFCASAAAIGPWVTKKPDLVWIYHPPLTTAIAGAFIAWIKRVPFVYEIHDIWPETLTSTGVAGEGRITKAIENICQKLYKRAAALVVTSDGMKDLLIEKGVSAAKIKVVFQWANEDIYRPVSRDAEFGAEHGLDGKFNIMFAGNMGKAQGLDTLIEAAALLRDRKDIRLVMVGDGLEIYNLQHKVEHMGLDNVLFLGHHPAKSMPDFFAWADAMVLHLKSNPLFDRMIPGKLQSYLACGRPVICAVNGDAERYMKQSESGLCCEPENPRALADSMIAMADMDPKEREAMGQRGRALFEEVFTERVSVEKYDRLFQSILAPATAVVMVPADPPATAVVQAREPAETSVRS